MSSCSTKKPTDGVTARRVTESPDPKDHLLERMLSRENMQRAWARVKSNKGAPGIDGVSIEAFPEIARDHWDSIRSSLLDGTHPTVAIPLCLTRKGPWRSARTMATQTGMTNQWLKDQGLIVVKELWVKIHYPATAR